VANFLITRAGAESIAAQSQPSPSVSPRQDSVGAKTQPSSPSGTYVGWVERLALPDESSRSRRSPTPDSDPTHGRQQQAVRTPRSPRSPRTPTSPSGSAKANTTPRRNRDGRRFGGSFNTTTATASGTLHTTQNNPLVTEDGRLKNSSGRTTPRRTTAADKKDDGGGDRERQRAFKSKLPRRPSRSVSASNHWQY
jgi:hypothetical protein